MEMKNGARRNAGLFFSYQGSLPQRHRLATDHFQIGRLDKYMGSLNNLLWSKIISFSASSARLILWSMGLFRDPI